jgi:hypothetical protein
MQPVKAAGSSGTAFRGCHTGRTSMESELAWLLLGLGLVVVELLTGTSTC